MCCVYACLRFVLPICRAPLLFNLAPTFRPFLLYTCGRLLRAGEVPSIEWEKDFKTWDGLGGWILVNLVSLWALLFSTPAPVDPHACPPQRPPHARRHTRTCTHARLAHTLNATVKKCACADCFVPPSLPHSLYHSSRLPSQGTGLQYLPR